MRDGGRRVTEAEVKIQGVVRTMMEEKAKRENPELMAMKRRGY